MVGDAVFRIIIGPDLFGSVAGPDLRSTRFSAFGIAGLLFSFVEPDLQLLHRLVAVHMLRLFRARGDDAGRQVGDTDRRVGGVNVLPTRPLGAHRIDSNIFRSNFDFDVFWGR